MELSKYMERQIVESKYTTSKDSDTNEVIGRQILEFTKTILSQVKSRMFSLCICLEVMEEEKEVC